jgi:tRNA-specific 2-thiouridylase
VTEIQPETNTVVLGDIEDLDKNAMYVRNINMVKYAHVDDFTPSNIKIRYKDVGHHGFLFQEGSRMKVLFDHEVKAIAPGQSAVFYEGNDVIGGGWIEKPININN